MTNNYPGLARGPIDHESSSVINVIANEALNMGDSVALVAAPSTELLPRVDAGDSADEPLYGIAVGGDADGIYGTGAADSDGTTQASAQAGDAVVVCTQGRCLTRVLTGVALGAKLEQSATIGVLETAVAGEVIAIALQASTGTDIIAVDVQREGLV